MEKSAPQVRNQKRGLWLLAGLGVLLALSGVLVWRSQTVAKAQFALDQAYALLETGSKQDAARALPLLNEAARLAPKMAEVYLARGYAYKLEGELEKAVGDNAQAVSLAPDNVEAHIAYANVLNMTKQYRRALKISERAIALDPENPGGYFDYGVACRRLEMYPQALRAFDKCIELEPKMPHPYLQRAYVLRAQDKNKRAFEACSAAIRYGSGEIMVDAYVVRGNASAAQKQFYKAISDYNTAILIDPKSAPAFHNRGRSYQQLKKFALALNDFNRVIALDPKLESAYKHRAQIFAVRKEWKKAIANYTKVLSLDQNYDSARLGRAWANFQSGQAAQAEKDCTFLIQHNRLRSAAYADRGLARLLQFRDKEANQDFETARAIAQTEKIKTSEVAWKALEKEIAKAKVRRSLQR